MMPKLKPLLITSEVLSKTTRYAEEVIEADSMLKIIKLFDWKEGEF
jgi:hypothetical protein